MAKKKAAPVEDLEELDEEDLEDLDLDEDEAEDDEVDEEYEAPKAGRKKGKTTKKASKKTTSDTIGSSELAEALGVSGRELRVLLRKQKVSKNDNNRYEWTDVESALEELGFDDVGDAREALDAARKDRIDELKKKTADKKKAKKSAPASDEDEDDDEDGEPAPKSKKKGKK